MSDAPRGFSREQAPPWITRPEGLVYSRTSHGAFPPRRLALSFNALFRQRAHVSLLRPRWDSMAPGRGILTAYPSAQPYLVRVRSRLTPGRLASPGNPWSFGDGVSRPICRYLYLHLLFRLLHTPSRECFAGIGMLPYRWHLRTIPQFRHRTYARLLSTRGRSTSELLRTL